MRTTDHSGRVIVYTPASSLRRPLVLVREMLADVGGSWELSWRLAKRDISAQYRGSILGYTWAFLLPLANTLAWVFLNAAGIVKVSSTGMPYPVYVLTGTMLWQMFVEALQSPLQQVGLSKSMLTKLNFPRESLIVSGMLKWCFNALIKLVILVVALLFFRVPMDAHLLLVPVAAMAILLAGTSLGLIVSPIGVLYADVSRSIPILAQFAMFISPVVFAMPAAGITKRLFELNFTTPLILTGRAWLTGSPSPMLGYFLGVMLVSFILLIIGWLLFRVAMPILIERMSS